MKKVFVGLSGGVDSAVSAALLQQEGYDVTGVFIRIALDGYPCSAGVDKIDAMRVAAHLRIPFIEIDLSREYKDEVFRHTVNEFAKGRTPNPDTLCNQKIKFGHFYDFAMRNGADFVATGHYAQIKDDLLFAGADSNKDQSYFLWMVPEEHLRHTLFPVGHLQKSEVRALAAKFGLPNAARKDSQGLCFLGDISIEDMLKREVTTKEGNVLDESGSAIGIHQGSILYTLGQRHGFLLSAHTSAGADVQPHYVIAKNNDDNTITVSTSRFPKNATKTLLTLTDTNWIGRSVAKAMTGTEVTARFRYRATLIKAELTIEKNEYLLLESHYVPEGQSLVFYRRDPSFAQGFGEAQCIGGGVVDNSELI